MAANDPWSKMHSSIFNHEKTRRVAKLLGETMYNAAGAVLALVGYINLNAPDGELVGWDENDVEKAIGWEGQKGSFFCAILDAGFLDKTRDGYRIHNRMAYAGAYKNAIKQGLKRKKAKKKKKRSPTKSVPRTVPGTVPRTVPVHEGVASISPSPTSVSDVAAPPCGAVSAASVSDAAGAPISRSQDPRAPTQAELQAEADAVDAFIARRKNPTLPPNKNTAPQGDDVWQQNPPGEITPARVPRSTSPLGAFLTHHQPSAPVETTSHAEIVENDGLSLNVIIDAMRTGQYGQVIKLNHHGRGRLNAILAENVVTRDMLDEAFAKAVDWHRDTSGTLGGRVEVSGTAMAKCLQTVCHERKQEMDLRSNIVGVVRGERLATEQGTPLAKLGGGLTRQEAAVVRRDAEVLRFARELREEREGRKRLTERVTNTTEVNDG